MAKEETDNDLCRCCHNEGSFKNLYETYSWLEEEVVCFNMLQECLDIEMLPVSEDLQHVLCAICEECLERLHEAVRFKRQVQKCERRFRDVYGSFVQGEGVNLGHVIKQEEENSNEPSDSAKTMKRKIGKNKKNKDGGKSKKTVSSKIPEGAEEKTGQNESEDSEDDIAAKKPKGTSEHPVKVVRKNIHFKVMGDVVQCLFCTFNIPVIKENRRRFNKIRRHITYHHIPIHECSSCRIKFHAKTKLMAHQLKQHNIDDRIKCNACDARFCLKRQLINHMNITHKLGIQLKCNKCDYETYSKYYLAKHELVHLNDKKLKCEYCQKSFKRNSNLKIHKMIHTGEKSKKCSECGAAFVQRASLKYHMLKHHPGVHF